MELKNYQRRVLSNLCSYIGYYANCADAALAYDKYLAAHGQAAGKQGVEYYVDELGGVPKVCVKVPTGGGKTFIAANALGVICGALEERPADVVVWLVPRKEILRQTLRQLRDPANSLRMAIDRDFAHCVEVLDKEDGLRGRGFTRATVEDQLTLFVLSYDSFKNKDGRRAFAENSSLEQLTDYQRKTGQAREVAGADDTALITALAGTSPIVVVDESHHAKSKLSIEMLRNLNPRFVLELTATPRKGSNVISRVKARELKDEHMVKLPVIVYRRRSKREVVQDAILLRRKLEEVAVAAEKERGDGYIRPIALLQAQPKGGDDAETYDKLKDKLVDVGVPAEHIAIRTGDKDELGDVDLMLRTCPIRYIITVEALAEGWDCPFAYILATVANKASKVSVEQIVGRVLRQPYARPSTARSLNTAYVLSSSEDFNNTIDQVIAGLNGAGFSKRDVVESESDPFAPPAASGRPAQEPIDFGGANGGGASPDDMPDGRPGTGSSSLDAGTGGAGEDAETSGGAGAGIDGIIAEAERNEKRFEEDASASGRSSGAGDTGLGDDMDENKMRAALAGRLEDFRLPVFHLRRPAGLFSDRETQPLEKGLLLDGFQLGKCATTGISFDALGNDDARKVDIDDESDELKVRVLDKRRAEELQKLFAGYSEQSKRDAVHGELMGRMPPRIQKFYGDKGLRAFIGRVVEEMAVEQLDAYLDNASRYAGVIMSAIKREAAAYAKERFNKMLNDDIVIEHAYKLPPTLAVREPMTMYDRTLYEAECGDMNGLERKMADALSNSERILWWHRVDEKKKGVEFCINGFTNHYPDFIAMTVDGGVLAIETKGEQLKNDDSRDKLELGGTWELMAGQGFRYCMVFDHDALDERNAYTFDAFKSEILNRG